MALLDRIRLEVVSSAHGPQGAGAAIAGLLLGTRLENFIRVLGWEPIVRQRIFGYSFLLSGQDEQRLREQLELLHHRSARTGLIPVGWFVSDLAGCSEPNRTLRQLHAGHFMDAGQILLMCQPELMGDMQVRVSTRLENHDRLTTYDNILHVEARRDRRPQHPPDPASPTDTARGSRWTRQRRSSRPEPLPDADDPPGLVPRRSGWPAPPEWANAPLLLASIVFLIVLASVLWLRNQGIAPVPWAIHRSGLSHWALPPDPEPAMLPRQLTVLHAQQKGARLQLRWDPAPFFPASSLGGEVVVTTQNGSAHLKLTPARLKRGTASLALPGPAELVGLTVNRADGKQEQMSLRLLAGGGQRPVQP